MEPTWPVAHAATATATLMIAADIDEGLKADDDSTLDSDCTEVGALGDDAAGATSGVATPVSDGSVCCSGYGRTVAAAAAAAPAAFDHYQWHGRHGPVAATTGAVGSIEATQPPIHLPDGATVAPVVGASVTLRASVAEQVVVEDEGEDGVAVAASGGLLSAFTVRGRLLVAAGFGGELVVKDLARGRLLHYSLLTHDENAITNAVQLVDGTGAGTDGDRLLTASNDCVVRLFDTERLGGGDGVGRGGGGGGDTNAGGTGAPVAAYKLDWAVNAVAQQPRGGKLFAAVGDALSAVLLDSASGKTVATLGGHTQFSFAVSWHPDGHLFATGSQDHTCRVWDIDLFGEVGGLAWSPDGDALFVGIHDVTYGSLMEFHRTDYRRESWALL
ncbi:hypothetical protein I4F81_001506 [Pyropia yezoensis]|uniref:Uncharacterized protein n=1 Tax=Pyropia yezoensis TaxID=2788 RepID=A0ACC3BM67_PYRYE|nr:hypothetical protein I4F81_001506 [Neopyropia yezoensis]